MDQELQTENPNVASCPSCQNYFSFRSITAPTCLYCPNCSFVIQVTIEGGQYVISMVEDPESLGIPLQNPQQKPEVKNTPISAMRVRNRDLVSGNFPTGLFGNMFPGNPTHGYVPGTNYPLVALHDITSNFRSEVYRLHSENILLRKKLLDIAQDIEDYKESKSRKTKKSAPSKRPRLVAEQMFTKWADLIKKKIYSMKFFLENEGEIGSIVPLKEKMCFEDYKVLFNQKGLLTQPTQTNKPRSQVYIRKFADFDEVQDLFGEAALEKNGYAASEWKRTDTSTKKKGSITIYVRSLDVSFSKNKTELTLKFTCTV